MLQKTRAIVFSQHRYGENSAIVRLYTRSLGVKAYSVHALQAKKSKAAFFQPLSILDLVLYNNEKREINQIKEINNGYLYKTVHTDISKMTICLFLSEFLSKILPEGHHDEVLYDFIESAMMYFDTTADNFANFHLVFLFRIMQYLGFGLETKEAFFRQLNWQNYDDKELNLLLNHCIEGNFEAKIVSNRNVRKQLLDLILAYFALHIEAMPKMKSLDVLTAVFDN